MAVTRFGDDALAYSEPPVFPRKRGAGGMESEERTAKQEPSALRRLTARAMTKSLGWLKP